jgi:hypothetical protein
MNFSIHAFFLVPLAMQLVLLLGAGWFYRNKGLQHQTKPKANIYRCVNCKKVYIDPRIVPLAKCPACNTLNEVVKR